MRCFYLSIRILRIRIFFDLILILITGSSNPYFSATGSISSMKGSIDNFILPEEELDITVCILVLASNSRCSVNSRMCYQYWFFSKLNLNVLLGYWFDSFHEALNREVQHSSGGFDWKIIFFGPCIIIMTFLAWFVSIQVSILGFQFLTNRSIAKLSVSIPHSVCSKCSTYAFKYI